MSDYATAQLMQIVERLIMVSTVVEVDRGNARAKVDWGNGAASAWLPIAQLGSEALKFWIPPTVGTQVIVLSPGGDTTRGIILAGPFASAPPAGNFEGDISGKGNVAVSDGDVTVSGGDVIAEGVSLVTHIHGEVAPGPSDTGNPK
ncbi:phage baseplate assembly protein V [Ruegeria sp. A3M17]|uniref:phage baseplate assembly protein V n=1 Tax=Ruegeria sp. A3M17 TaxID=2267229 RepID=UPI001F405D3A|nr:phage baseplate assembly protein V [Ruegeria sp. A3M17]